MRSVVGFIVSSRMRDIKYVLSIECMVVGYVHILYWNDERSARTSPLYSKQNIYFTVD